MHLSAIVMTMHVFIKPPKEDKQINSRYGVRNNKANAVILLLSLAS
jgi:hypothetical protein